MYYREGFIKKFPLKQSKATIGREMDNDLVIDDDFVSNHHLEIRSDEDFIVIHDLNSTNGTYVEGVSVNEAVIPVGGSFCVGRTEFFLKQGAFEEFEPAKELIRFFEHIGKENERKAKSQKTKYIRNIYTELLRRILQTGLKRDNLKDLIRDLSNYLSLLTDLGSLFIVSKKNGRVHVLFSIKRHPQVMKFFDRIIRDVKIFKRNKIFQPLSSSTGHFYSYALSLDNTDSVIIYIPKEMTKREDAKVEEFLSMLAEEISLLSQIITSSHGTTNIMDGEERISDGIDIITDNTDMKRLLERARKIARSNLFVLIQGESGTGKELFARLIHNRSKRKKGSYVALNCASIPENLLESELFGYEKGAFTGAVRQTKGKLEVASLGTLVLDEVGDMPLSLQAKLLRAIQEQEFYRVGGIKPIKVNLRIISLTNKNLKEMVEKGEFRQDLYFRLVHRTLYITPLRERKEDIAVLINYFTRKFCANDSKNIQAYSVKALEVLENYDWPGNVRELENEINSIVNLTDDNELITCDIISPDIRGDDENFPCEEFGYEESEADGIRRLLEKNNWNKSRTAREIGMTYRGLHKKMQRLGIQRPADIKQ